MHLHGAAGQLETVEMFHGLLGVLGLVVDDEPVALRPVRLRVLHELDRLDPTKGLKYTLKRENYEETLPRSSLSLTRGPETDMSRLISILN